MRTIKYYVSLNSISPQTRSYGGNQFEDNATQIVYNLDEELSVKISMMENVSIRIDFNSAQAGYDPSPSLSANAIYREIPYKYTRHGGEMEATLVITELDQYNNEVRTILSKTATIYFSAVNRGKETEKMVYDSISALEKQIQKNVEDGIYNGKDGKDGISATHEWNGTTLTITSASGTSSADLKGDQGIQGEKGDKGDKGDKGEKGDNSKEELNDIKTEIDATNKKLDNLIAVNQGKTFKYTATYFNDKLKSVPSRAQKYASLQKVEVGTKEVLSTYFDNCVYNGNAESNESVGLTALGGFYNIVNYVNAEQIASGMSKVSQNNLNYYRTLAYGQEAFGGNYVFHIPPANNTDNWRTSIKFFIDGFRDVVYNSYNYDTGEVSNRTYTVSAYIKLGKYYSAAQKAYFSTANLIGNLYTTNRSRKSEDFIVTDEWQKISWTIEDIEPNGDKDRFLGLVLPNGTDIYLSNITIFEGAETTVVDKFTISKELENKVLEDIAETDLKLPNSNGTSYIDFENKALYKKTNTVDLSTLDWKSYSSQYYKNEFYATFSMANCGPFSYANLVTDPSIPVTTAEMFPYLNWENLEQGIKPEKAIRYLTDSYDSPFEEDLRNGTLYLYYQGCNTVEELKQALQGTMMLYETFGQGEKIDLSQYISDDNFIVVKPYGVIESYNESLKQTANQLTFQEKLT